MLNTKKVVNFLYSFLVLLSIANIYLVSEEFYNNYKDMSGITFPNNKTLGGDFIAFFTGGTLYKNNRPELYSYEAQYDFQKEYINNKNNSTGFLPFVYPPLVAWFFSHLILESYQHSYFLWAGISTFTYLFTLYSLSSRLELSFQSKIMSLICFLGMPTFYLRTIMGGQTGAIAVLLSGVLFLLMDKNRYLLSGLWSGLFYYKPPMFLILTLWSIITKPRNWIYGFSISAILLLLLTFLILPIETIIEYINVSSNYSYGSSQYGHKISVPHKGAGIYALMVSFIALPPELLRAIMLVIVLTAVYGVCSRLDNGMSNNENLKTIEFCIVLVTSLIFSVHILDYDLCVLSVPLLLGMSILHKKSMTKEIIPGLFIVLLLQLDLALPDIDFGKYTLSKYSILSGFVLMYYVWIYKKLYKI